MIAGLPTYSARFLAKVSIAGAGNCWLWTGGRHVRGYGIFKLKNKSWKAHRVSWLIHRGPIPNGLHVLHKCDNPPCVNPRHLFLGTHQDNMDDRDAEGRRAPPKGEKNGRAILTRKKVRQIRRIYAAGGITQKVLGARYGFAQAHISAITTGKLWP